METYRGIKIEVIDHPKCKSGEKCVRFFFRGEEYGLLGDPRGLTKVMKAEIDKLLG